VSTHASVEDLLRDAAVDAVLVATPTHLSFPVSLSAIRAAKHVLGEKPIALTEQEAEVIEREATAASVTFMAGYSMRFSLAGRLHDLLTAGVAGAIQTISGVIGCPPLEAGWVASTSTGGGPLLFIGSHLVDMFLWFAADDPVELGATVQRRPATETDQTSAFWVRFDRGALAQGLVTQAASTFFFSVDVLGNQGRVALRGLSWSQYEIELWSSVNAAYSQPTVIRPYMENDHVSTMLVPELEEFARAIAEGRAPAITAADGRRVLRVLDGVLAADRRGVAISIG
jgi:predicted dehydrogenase